MTFDQFTDDLKDAMKHTPFELYRQAWTGWDEPENDEQSDDTGMGAFLKPIENSLEELQEEIDKAILKDIYDSIF